jgi:hypothetical protein
MPPRRYKVNHHKDKGSSYAGFLERNAEVLPEQMLKKKKERDQLNNPHLVPDENDSDDEEPKAGGKRAPQIVVKTAGSGSDSSDNDDATLEQEFGRPGSHGGETRKEREARMAEEARKKYQELHLAGKTAEAKADIARLAEVRRRREEAAAKAKKEKEEKEAASSRGRRTGGHDVVREAFM